MATMAPTVSKRMLRFVPEESSHEDLSFRYMKHMLAHERQEGFSLAHAALDDGLSLQELYLDVLQPVQHDIGWLWQTGKISVGHEHYCTNATQLLMASLYPRLFKPGKKGLRLLAACVEGELHELGVRMLADVFEMEGWNTDFLGANTPQESVIQMLEATEADVLAIGISMYYHLDKVEQLVSATKKHFKGDEPVILVGGYPFRNVDALWGNVGADGTALDANEAVRTAEALVRVSGQAGDQT